MKKPFVALLLLVGAVAMVATLAFAQDAGPGAKLVNAKMNRELMMQSRAARAHVSADGDPDTVWFGHSATNHNTTGNNPWNLYTGTYEPGTGVANNALWDFDDQTGIAAADSLQGWWPIRRIYGITGGLTLPDASRAWNAIDIGNTVNYVLNAHGGRTKGVVGVWHSDGGNTEGANMTWPPIDGSRSAWCGLRDMGDVTNMDPITHNALNASVAEFVGEVNSPTRGTNKVLPGYLGQWDQMLYRDFDGTSGAFAVSFKYRTKMSTGVDLAAATRTGWFHGDPLSVTPGNFISSSDAGSAAPIDSFMVYVGAPVDDANCTYSDGVVRPVYDPQRRWFSEVLRIFDGTPYYEIFSQFGISPVDSTASNTVNVTVPASFADAIRNASGNTSHTIRLVFRVKTNRGWDDGDGRGSGFTSGSCGAATVDDVSINGGAAFGFENATDIDNSTGTLANATWKSTGKPPGIYFHLRDINDLTYHDLCGAWNSPARFCNIGGSVVSAGNFDDAEKTGDSRFTSDREVLQGMLSPTMDWKTAADSSYNEQGLRRQTVDVSDDYYVQYTLYAGEFNLQFSGEAWTFGSQAYPCLSTNHSTPMWGELLVPTFQIFNPEPQCFEDIEPFKFYNLMMTAATTSGIPDSVRMFMGENQQCFRFAISLGCNSADGCYFDNISMGFVDVPAGAQVASNSAATIGGVSADIWQFINDAFPANETPGLAGTANYDTAGAVLQTGFNIAQSTGDALRYDIAGDTMIVRAADAVGGEGGPHGNSIRVDLVFRILPGPGNYKASAARNYDPSTGALTGTLLQVPQNQANVVVPGDASFWGQYIADPGTFGTAGGHGGGTAWDNTTWNSARCDTLERNIFPLTGTAKGAIGSGLTTAQYMNTYEESDPKFATLGQLKNKCFVVDPNSPAVQLNIVCDGTVPAWVTTNADSDGYDGNAQTKEFTKIIPDGLLTPGSHVQYFFRKSLIDDGTLFSMCPDTNSVTPQNGEGPSLDGHRWQQFSVLPDRWKAIAFGGLGAAPMLYVDFADRRGDERTWVSVMDSIGSTAVNKWGAHNGWHARGDQGTLLGPGAGSDPTIAVHRNSQPGTTWDMYGVKASESLTTSAGALGERYAFRGGMTTPPMSPKYDTSGPTKEVLRAYYRMVALLSGDLNSGVLGPFANRSQNDIDLLNDYLTNSGGTVQPRGLFVMGDGFVESETQTGGVDATHTSFLNTKLGVSLRNASYQSISGNTSLCADLLTTSAINSDGDIYGVGNSCQWSNDLLNLVPAISEAVVSTNYENVGTGGPFIAGALKPANGTRNWIAETEGYQIRHLWSRYCLSDQGRIAFYWKGLNKAFGSVGVLTGTAAQTLGVPENQHGATFTNFMKVGNSVMRTGNASIHFGLANTDRVKIKMYDVTGRLVRTLADRSFNAGEYNLAWDGTDDGGVQVARGVYFARIEYATRGAAINGRVVVLR